MPTDVQVIAREGRVMSCPTCSATMQCLGVVIAGGRYFWCPRCGTIRRVAHVTSGPEMPNDDVPSLVERCREFEQTAVRDINRHPGARDLLGILDRLGISEAISTPENRRPS